MLITKQRLDVRFEKLWNLAEDWKGVLVNLNGFSSRQMDEMKRGEKKTRSNFNRRPFANLTCVNVRILGGSRGIIENLIQLKNSFSSVTREDCPPLMERTRNSLVE